MHSRTKGQARYLVAAVLAATLVAAGSVLGAGPAAAASHQVTISSYSYQPASLTVTAGDSVTWTNLDSVAHDVTVTRGPTLFHSPMLGKGQSWSYTFTVAGPYSYVCSVHPDMRASLTVLAAVPVKVAPAAKPMVHKTAVAIAAPAVGAQAAPLDTASSTTRINPLLLVGGALCAVLIFCLLVIASRPQSLVLEATVIEPAQDEPTRVLPPPPPVD